MTNQRCPHGINISHKEESVCDFCGEEEEVLVSKQFDNGNASMTRIRVCRNCLKNLQLLFSDL